MNTVETKTALDCLRYAAMKAERDGKDASRTTREVADWCGISLAAARRQLWAAVEDGAAVAMDGGASGERGNPIFWELANARSQS